jgi:hypothetical protein
MAMTEEDSAAADATADAATTDAFWPFFKIVSSFLVKSYPAK